MGECDVDDILCQASVLAHLRGLRMEIGNERFASEFPELQIINDRITQRETLLRETLGKCGLEPISDEEILEAPDADNQE